MLIWVKFVGTCSIERPHCEFIPTSVFTFLWLNLFLNLLQKEKKLCKNGIAILEVKPCVRVDSVEDSVRSLKFKPSQISATTNSVQIARFKVLPRRSAAVASSPKNLKDSPLIPERFPNDSQTILKRIAR